MTCATCGTALEPIPDVGWVCLNNHAQPNAELNAAAGTPSEPEPGVAYGFTVCRMPAGEILLNAPGVPVSIVVDMLERSLVVARRNRARIQYSQRMSKTAGDN